MLSIAWRTYASIFSASVPARCRAKVRTNASWTRSCAACSSPVSRYPYPTRAGPRTRANSSSSSSQDTGPPLSRYAPSLRAETCEGLGSLGVGSDDAARSSGAPSGPAGTDHGQDEPRPAIPDPPPEGPNHDVQRAGLVQRGHVLVGVQGIGQEQPAAGAQHAQRLSHRGAAVVGTGDVVHSQV